MQVNTAISPAKAVLTCVFCFLTGLSVLPVCAQVKSVRPPFFSPEASKWADSVLTTLSQRERIAQLFMVDAFSNKDSAHVRVIDSLVQEYGIGGLIFFSGRTNTSGSSYQSLSA